MLQVSRHKSGRRLVPLALSVVLLAMAAPATGAAPTTAATFLAEAGAGQVGSQYAAVRRGPVRRAPVPKAPVPKAHVPKAHVPKAHVPKAHVPKAHVPKAPVPKAPVRRPPVTTAARAAAAQVARTSGSPSAYSFMATVGDRPVRWNPCAAIAYVVNPAGMPAGATADITEAFRRIEEASGLRFVAAGTSTDVPSNAGYKVRTRPAGEWPAVLIAWSTPAQSDMLDGHVAGLGGATWAGFAGEEVFVTGQIVLDRMLTARLEPGFGAGGTFGALLLHELTHVVGLGHTDDEAQIMYGTVTDKEARFGAGDLAGLAELGASKGCLVVPAPPD